jgi:hypothetical protein
MNTGYLNLPTRYVIRNEKQQLAVFKQEQGEDLNSAYVFLPFGNE